MLNKYLNFCPTPGKYSKTIYDNDIQNFIRKVKLKAHFKTTDLSEKIDGNFYIKSSTNKQWTPKETHNTAETFIEAFKSKLQKENHIKKKLPKNNLAKNEIALKNLSIRDDIKVTKADKGGVVVIIDVDDVADYIAEANLELNSKKFYKEIPNDPTELSRKKFNNVIKELKSARLLNEKITTKLDIQEAKIQAFYMFPKLHKPENPGRPVISSVNYHTTSISQYVNHHLQPHVKELKSYVKDSTDFIKKKKIIIIMYARSLKIAF